MPHSREAEAMYLVARYGDFMHDLVRTFVQKHYLITTLAQTPDVAWTWIHECLEDLAAELEPGQHDELAPVCYKAIAPKWKAEMQGEHRGLH